MESITDFNYAALLKGRDAEKEPAVQDMSKLPSQFYMHIKVFSQKYTLPIKVKRIGDDNSSSDDESSSLRSDDSIESYELNKKVGKNIEEIIMNE